MTERTRCLNNRNSRCIWTLANAAQYTKPASVACSVTEWATHDSSNGSTYRITTTYGKLQHLGKWMWGGGKSGSQQHLGIKPAHKTQLIYLKACPGTSHWFDCMLGYISLICLHARRHLIDLTAWLVLASWFQCPNSIFQMRTFDWIPTFVINVQWIPEAAALLPPFCTSLLKFYLMLTLNVFTKHRLFFTCQFSGAKC